MKNNSNYTVASFFVLVTLVGIIGIAMACEQVTVTHTENIESLEEMIANIEFDSEKFLLGRFTTGEPIGEAGEEYRVFFRKNKIETLAEGRMDLFLTIFSYDQNGAFLNSQSILYYRHSVGVFVWYIPSGDSLELLYVPSAGDFIELTDPTMKKGYYYYSLDGATAYTLLQIDYRLYRGTKSSYFLTPLHNLGAIDTSFVPSVFEEHAALMYDITSVNHTDLLVTDPQQRYEDFVDILDNNLPINTARETANFLFYLEAAGGTAFKSGVSYEVRPKDLSATWGAPPIAIDATIPWYGSQL